MSKLVNCGCCGTSYSNMVSLLESNTILGTITGSDGDLMIIRCGCGSTISFCVTDVFSMIMVRPLIKSDVLDENDLDAIVRDEWVEVL